MGKSTAGIFEKRVWLVSSTFADARGQGGVPLAQVMPEPDARRRNVRNCPPAQVEIREADPCRPGTFRTFARGSDVVRVTSPAVVQVGIRAKSSSIISWRFPTPFFPLFGRFLYRSLTLSCEISYIPSDG